MNIIDLISQLFSEYYGVFEDPLKFHKVDVFVAMLTEFFEIAEIRRELREGSVFCRKFQEN